jgi:hypothetical protein
VFTNAFSNNLSLEEVYFEGEIGKSVSFSVSPLLPECMCEIISHLVNYAGTDSEGKYKVIFKEDCWDALEASGWGYDPILDQHYPALDGFNGTWRELVMALGWLT